MDAARAGSRIIATAVAGAGLLACEPTLSEVTTDLEAAYRDFQVFRAIDRHSACERAAAPHAFAAVPPGSRLVEFTLRDDGRRTVSVVGRRGEGPWIDMVSWQTGRAYAVAQPAVLISPWNPVRPPSAEGEPQCGARFERRADPDKAMERADPSTFRMTKVRNEFGEGTVTQFATRGRTLVCLNLHMNAAQPADAILILSGMDCREMDPGAAERQRRDLLPVIKSLAAGAE